MNAETENKCGHPACGCPRNGSGRYCSQSCADAAGVAEIACQCGHSDCLATVTAPVDYAMSYLKKDL